MASKHVKRCSTSLILENANQNYSGVSEWPSDDGQNCHHQKNLQMISTGEGVEKKEPSYIIGGNVN